jgi:hypothetical protein
MSVHSESCDRYLISQENMTPQEFTEYIRDKHQWEYPSLYLDDCIVTAAGSKYSSSEYSSYYNRQREDDEVLLEEVGDSRDTYLSTWADYLELKKLDT